MKKIFLSIIFLLNAAIGVAAPTVVPSSLEIRIFGKQLESPPLTQRAFDDVPLDHWSYSAAEHLIKRSHMQGFENWTFRNRVLTRFEFAVVVARWLESPPDRQGDPSCKDIATMLCYEYTEEVTHILLIPRDMDERLYSAEKQEQLDKAASLFNKNRKHSSPDEWFIFLQKSLRTPQTLR